MQTGDVSTDQLTESCCFAHVVPCCQPLLGGRNIHSWNGKAGWPVMCVVVPVVDQAEAQALRSTTASLSGWKWQPSRVSWVGNSFVSRLMLNNDQQMPKPRSKGWKGVLGQEHLLRYGKTPLLCPAHLVWPNSNTTGIFDIPLRRLLIWWRIIHINFCKMQIWHSYM